MEYECLPNFLNERVLISYSCLYEVLSHLIIGNAAIKTSTTDELL